MSSATLEKIRDGLHGVKGAPDNFTARCPGHDDSENSLSITRADNGKILVHCHAGCATGDVLTPLGLKTSDLYPPKPTKSKKQIECCYDYHDVDGNLVFQVVRFKPKDFRQRRPDPTKPGGWAWNLSGIKQPLYHFPDVLKAKADGKAIYLVEGEKDADSLVQLGVCSTTNAGGAAKWSKAYADTLDGADVIVLPDNDKPGIEAAWIRANTIPGAIVVELPDLPTKGDITDWIARGGTLPELEALVAQARKKPSQRPVVDVQAKPARSKQASNVDPQSELANAHRLASIASGDLRHAIDRGWLHWDGARWDPNEKATRRTTYKIGELIRREAYETTDDPDLIKEYYRTAKRAESATGVEGILKLAASLEDLDANGIEFDGDPWALNFRNGTVDLRIGELRPHKREDYNTKLCPHDYNAEATCPRWLAFLDEVFCGDQQIIEWIHWLCGYSVTGSTHRHLLPILHGSGRNGKSVFLKALRHVIGSDYSVAIDPEDLMAKNNTQHNHSLARLRGARFAMAQETAENRRLNEALIKTLTGDDPIIARALYSIPFEFMPSHKLWMSTNYKPRIGGSAPAIWERVRLVPFDRQFEQNEQDLDLDAKLRAEAPGILAWCVAGARMSEPLIPERVRAATDEYREESDVLGAFIDEALTLEWEHSTVSKRDVYEAYKQDRNNHCEGFKEFNKRLEGRGFESVKKSRGACWKGVALQSKHVGCDVA